MLYIPRFPIMSYSLQHLGNSLNKQKWAKGENEHLLEKLSSREILFFIDFYPKKWQQQMARRTNEQYT